MKNHDFLKEYQVLKDLGSGSYGRVQLIKRKEDQKLYALKSMMLASAKQKEKDAALNEIRLLASITMPYVISYKTSFYVPETQTLCIVMEYADGGDLENKINERSEVTSSKGFEENFIWKTAFQLLKGLRGLHEHNIIHRDLKCANIFFVKGVAKIGDLNISKITENGFASTQTGTPYYTSPEIWKGQKYDNKCDIWALGCIIYEMCTLLPPFRAQDFPGLFQAVTAGKYQQIPNTYSNRLKQFIAVCLKVASSDRPTAAALLEKPYFAQFELSVDTMQSEMENESRISIIDPIECPKTLRFLNDRLPKSKFEETGKKTVCFAGKEMESSTTFKIKTKKVRSEKTIIIEPEQPVKEQKQERRVPKFLVNRSVVRLPPLPLEKQQLCKTSKSAAKLERKGEWRSMKHIPEKENKKIVK